MSGTYGKFVCITIRDRKLTAIEFTQKKSRFVLLNYSQIQLDEGVYKSGQISDSAGFQAAIQNLLASAQPGAIIADSVILIVENNAVFNHCFTVPDVTDTSGLENIIPQKAETIIPFNRSELYWDYQLQRGDADSSNNKKLQYIAMPRRDVNQILAIFRSLKLDVLILTAEMEIYKSLVQNFDHSKEKVIVIELGYKKTQVLYYEDNVLVKLRQVDFDLEQYLAMLATEKQMSPESLLSLMANNVDQNSEDTNLHNEQFKPFLDTLAMYVNEITGGGLIVDHIYVWGEGLFVPHLFTTLRKRFQPIPEIKVLWQAITIDTKLRQNQQLLQLMNQNIIDFGITVNAAFSFVKLLLDFQMLNLLPHKQQIIARNKLIANKLAKVSVVIIGIYVVLIAFLFQSFFGFQTTLAELNQAVSAVNSREKNQEIQQISTDIGIFNTTAETFVRAVDNLQAFPETVVAIQDNSAQAGIVLTSVSYTAQTNLIVINGQAETRQALLSYQSKLDSIVPNDSFIDSPLSNFNQGTNINFNITVHLDGEPKTN